MIDFEASGWDFETREDICYALEEIIGQLQRGYQSGILGNFSWEITGEEVVYCECCNEIIEEDDILDPDGLRCLECFKEGESDDLPTT